MSTTLHQATVKEYGTAKGWRILVYLLAPPMILLFLAMPFLLLTDSHGRSTPVAFVLGFGALGWGLAGFFIYCLLETRKGRIILTDTQLVSQSLLKTKELAFDDIQGIRIDQNFTHVVPRQAGQTKIKIGYTTEAYAELQQWLITRFGDLDAQEQQVAAAALLTDHRLGDTEEERADKLAAARKTAQVLNITGGGAAAWLFLQPQPYAWAVGAGLLVPLLCLPALWLHAKTLCLAEKKNSGYPSATIALLMPSLALLLRSVLDHELLSYAPVWPLAGAVAAVFGGLLLLASRHFVRRSDWRLLTVGTAVAYAALYGFAATTTFNFAFDDARPAVYETKVTGKHTSSGKTTTYYLTVEKWGPVPGPSDVTVTADYYQQVEAGSTVSILLMPGKLDMPWYTVAE